MQPDPSLKPGRKAAHAVPAAMSAHLRIARPVSDLARSVRMYKDGLSLEELGHFADHEGFDGAMLGNPDGPFHLEFTHCRHQSVAPAPTPEDLLVFYVPDEKEWAARCVKLRDAGFAEIKPFNPFWSRRGRTFQDQDGYKVVIECSEWSCASRASMVQAGPHADGTA